MFLISFRFDITPVNRVGPGGDETKATVIVPEKSEVLTFPSRFQVIVYKDGNNTIYGIKWNITEEKIESQKIESVSIYWCKRRQYEERCLVCNLYFFIGFPSGLEIHQHFIILRSFIYLFLILVNNDKKKFRFIDILLYFTIVNRSYFILIEKIYTQTRFTIL